MLFEICKVSAGALEIDPSQKSKYGKIQSSERSGTVKINQPKNIQSKEQENIEICITECSLKDILLY